MAEEQGAFAFDDVARAIGDKLVRRHPHVFTPDGTPLPAGSPLRDPAQVEAQWAAIKAQERAARQKERQEERQEARQNTGAAPDPTPDPLGGVARALPALARAEKISRRAAAYGFDWDEAAQVVDKVREETDEVAEALAAGDPQALSEEIGDLLFSVANLARHAGIDPETALRDGTAKFERRFAAMARHLAASGGALGRSDLAAMEAAWQAAKRDEAGWAVAARGPDPNRATASRDPRPGPSSVRIRAALSGRAARTPAARSAGPSRRIRRAPQR